MDSRKLTAVMLVLMAVTIGFVTAPVFSGEHPWDSDRTQGDPNGTGGVLTQDTAVVIDTTEVASTLTYSAPGSSVWVNVLMTVWSVSLSL